MFLYWMHFIVYYVTIDNLCLILMLEYFGFNHGYGDSHRYIK